MSGLEIVGLTAAAADGLFQILKALKRRKDAHKRLSALIEISERCVSRIRGAVARYAAHEDKRTIPGEVFRRVVDDFDAIRLELCHL